jgi:hypothetical protein
LLDLITNQRHLQRGQVFYVASCHGFTPAHYNIRWLGLCQDENT